MHVARVRLRRSAVKDVQVDPFAPFCGLCGAPRIPIIGTYCRICSKCDGWPPRLEPPQIPRKELK